MVTSADCLRSTTYERAKKEAPGGPPRGHPPTGEEVLHTIEPSGELLKGALRGIRRLAKKCYVKSSRAGNSWRASLGAPADWRRSTT